MPFQTSPKRDNGYDVSDYYNVDPRFGTLGDFVEFTHGAKQRGMRVLIDLVVNHTSDQHPWFQSARSDPEVEVPRLVRVVGQEAGERRRRRRVSRRAEVDLDAATRRAKRWYFHRFYEFQPDLNTANPLVQAEILKIMGFWTQLGVSGFRMDAVPFVIADEGRRRTSSRKRSSTCCAAFANCCSGARATRSSSARPTCCRSTTSSTSATTATACR